MNEYIEKKFDEWWSQKETMWSFMEQNTNKDFENMARLFKDFLRKALEDQIDLKGKESCPCCRADLK